MRQPWRRLWHWPTRGPEIRGKILKDNERRWLPPCRRLVITTAPSKAEDGDGTEQWLTEARRRQLQPGAVGSHRGVPCDPARQGGGAPLRRHGDLRRDPGKRARRRRVRAPVDVLPGERPPHGVAHHHRRAAARLVAADHRRRAVFRLCPAGSEVRLANPDLRQAGRQHDHPGGRRPRHDRRSPCRPDPGLLRHSDRQPLRLAGDGARHQGALRPQEGDGGLTRRGRRGARARPRQAHRGPARHHRQAARAGQRVRK